MRLDWLPPFHYAAFVGDLATLEALLREGADVNARCDPGPPLSPYDDDRCGGMTPLMLAAHSTEGADVGTLRWLLDHGADPRATSTGGMTAAWYTVWDGADMLCAGSRERHHERLALLLDAGLGACERRADGQSLLSAAAMRADAASVRLLLAAGAPANPTWDAHDVQRARDQLRRVLTSLGGARAISDAAAARTAQRAYTAPTSYAIPLHAAAGSGSIECVGLLLEAGASLRRRDDDGLPALAQAASPEIVDLLVAAGADPCQRRSARSRKILAGDDVLAEVLCDTLARRRLDTARALLKHGAPLERAQRADSTRLYDAAFRCDADAVDWLLAQGARPNSDSECGRTPLHAVCAQGGFPLRDPHGAAERIVRALVAAGNDLAVRDDDGFSPLEDAVMGERGETAPVRTLLELGAPPDEPGPGGVTPLMLAAQEGRPACVRLLLAAGADPGRQDDQGWTAIDRARRLREASAAPQVDAPDDEVEAQAETLVLAEETVRLLARAGRAPRSAVRARGGPGRRRVRGR